MAWRGRALLLFFRADPAPPLCSEVLLLLPSSSCRALKRRTRLVSFRGASHETVVARSFDPASVSGDTDMTFRRLSLSLFPVLSMVARPSSARSFPTPPPRSSSSGSRTHTEEEEAPARKNGRRKEAAGRRSREESLRTRRRRAKKGKASAAIRARETNNAAPPGKSKTRPSKPSSKISARGYG